MQRQAWYLNLIRYWFFASKILYCFEAIIEAATHSHLGISLKPLQLQLQLQYKLSFGNSTGWESRGKSDTKDIQEEEEEIVESTEAIS